MFQSPASTARIHIRALGFALVLVLLTLAGSMPLFQHLEQRYIRDLIRKPYAEKNQGEFIQREAFVRDDVLPAYGSSELRLPMKNRADEFFRDAPTGFQVCPIGKAGNTALLMAEKIAALGDTVRGKKVVILVSYTWFQRPAVPAEHYAGNFSPYQVLSLLSSTEITDAIRDRIVTRIRDYPSTYEKEPVLAGYLNALSGQGMWPRTRLKFYGALARIQMAVWDWEDHFGSCCTLFSHGALEGESWHTEPREIDWEKLAPRSPKREVTPIPVTDADDELPAVGVRDDEFISSMNRSKEWADLALLLDLLHAQQAKALIINMPLRGIYDDAHGISGLARNYYYHRLEAVCRRHHVPVEDFQEHDHDGDFTVGGSTHPTSKGWLHMDRVIDDFFHDRMLRPAKK